MKNPLSSSLNRPLSIAGILCVVALTAFSFFSSPGKDALTRPKAALPQKGTDLSGTAPFFSERFVSREMDGPMTHVSSITPLPDGSLACVWYQGSKEGAKDVSIYLSSFRRESASWSEPKVLMSREQSSYELGRYVKKLGNPMIFSDAHGRLWLFYSSVFAGGWSGTSLNYKMSPDGGKIWGQSRKLILSPFFNLTNNVKNKPLELEDSSLLVPVYHEFINKYPQLLHFIPDENGDRYRIWRISTNEKAIQPSLIPEENGNIRAFFRNISREKEKHILTAVSHDLGTTWPPPIPTSLPNPNSGFDMITLDDGSILGVINNSFENRNDLSLVLSTDDGQTWKTVKVLENKQDHEYSYPSIVRDTSGIYHVTYTFERKRIKHIMFNEEWIREGAH